MHKLNGLILILALVVLLLGMPVARVFADARVILTKVASTDNASLGDNITYTYTIHTYDNCFEAKLVDDKIGEIPIPAELLAGANITATAAHVVSLADYSDNATDLVNTVTFTGSLTGGENITVKASESVALNQYQAGLMVTKDADKTVAALGDVIAYTYKVSNNGVVEIKDISLSDDPLGDIPLLNDNITITKLAPGESIIAKATYTVVFDDLRAGSIKNTAWATGTDPNGKAVTSITVEAEVSTNVFLSLLTKAGILKSSGVNGKGIDQAPGLQKPFNPNSQASQHAGKKDGKGELEKNQNQEQEMNGGNTQNQEEEINAGDEQQMNSNNGQNGKHEKNKDKEKGKGKGNGQGNNK